MKVQLEQDELGNIIMPIPYEIMNEVGWKVGDRLQWEDNMNGTFTLSKKDTELVLVEAIHLTKVQYLVEVPAGKAKWALDSVTLEEVPEFTAEDLGFQISSHRVVSRAEAIAEFRKASPHTEKHYTNEDILEEIHYIGE